MHFLFPQKILFKHCDPAGIVFYPRFVEMINDATEAMFEELLNWPFKDMHPKNGIPMVALSIEFKAPCFLGDELELDLAVKAIGNSSLTLHVQAVSEESLRFSSDCTIVCTGPDRRPCSWPAHVRQKINKLLENKS